MIRTVAGAGYEFKAEVMALRSEAETRQAANDASDSRRAVLARWIARRPALATGAALTAGVALTGTARAGLVHRFINEAADGNVSAFAAVTCS